MSASIRRAVFGFAFLAVVGYAFVTLRGPRGIPALLEKNRQAEILEQRNAARALSIERKRERIRRLRERPAELEMEIRRKFKLVDPEEKVYIVGEPEQN